MGISRIVNTDFWIDEKVIDTFSVEDKLFWLYLLTNPQTKQLGIYKLPIKLMAFQIGFSEDVVKVLIDRFERVYQIIKYNRETQEVAIKNYLKWSIIRGGKPVEDCIKADMEKVKDKSLITFVYKHLLESDINRTITLENIFEYIKENYSEDEPKAEPKKEAVKHKHGEHKNVLLTDEEYNKLLALENGERAIEYLSEHIALKGYKAKSHYLAIKKWVFDALKEQDLKALELQRKEERLRGVKQLQKPNNSMDIIKEIYSEMG